MNNKYCENCFYWVNRKEENPNISNCKTCAVNPYNKYEGVVIKCENDKEFKIAQEFFINRGIPMGINTFRDMYPCYIGIDEHRVKVDFKFTSYDVFVNKNIIWGFVKNDDVLIGTAFNKFYTIDEYLNSKKSLKDDNESPSKEDKTNYVTINTNPTVVGYIAGYEFPSKEDLKTSDCGNLHTAVGSANFKSSAHINGAGGCYTYPRPRIAIDSRNDQYVLVYGFNTIDKEFLCYDTPNLAVNDINFVYNENSIKYITFIDKLATKYHKQYPNCDYILKDYLNRFDINSIDITNKDDNYITIYNRIKMILNKEDTSFYSMNIDDKLNYLYKLLKK